MFSARFRVALRIPWGEGALAVHAPRLAVSNMVFQTSIETRTGTPWAPHKHHFRNPMWSCLRNLGSRRTIVVFRPSNRTQAGTMADAQLDWCSVKGELASVSGLLMDSVMLVTSAELGDLSVNSKVLLQVGP